MKDIVIKVENIYKSFNVGKQIVPVLKGISFDILKEDFVIIYGPSGCGKSTILHTILGLEQPNQGQIYILGKKIYGDNLNDDYRSEIRKRHIGMIYQQPNWIKAFTVLKNVAFPLTLTGVHEDIRLQKSIEMLTSVGMQNWKDYAPVELSSGQQQKVALARALITNPEIIIADEPTGNLDYESGQDLIKVLMKLNKEEHKTIIMVTHDLEYIKYAKSTIHMFDGKIANVKPGDLRLKRDASLKE